MQATTHPTLAELRRVMREDPREMPHDVLLWAVDTLERRVPLIPEGSPAREQYAARLRVLRAEATQR